MNLSATLSGKTYTFRDVKDVLAKASEEKSGDHLAGIAAESALERVAAKYVLSDLLVKDLRENPVVPYEDDEVTRINQDGQADSCDGPGNRSALHGKLCYPGYIRRFSPQKAPCPR
ncbi:MAG: ethanolamine ammonia-lyase subunit EutB [Firmicutes bacterium]|nr:ethanolamine ammonia-lyase subunit EutB [Bacillota bacterium]